MEARLLSAALAAAIIFSLGAGYRTQNFIVSVPSSPQFAREIGDAAEAYRRQLALEWLGSELPAWRDPCPIHVQVGSHLGAGGATSFMFDSGGPHGWTMSIQGSRERLLDSVLPHEITHTIFATHFGRPLPRWADEGACTTVEHEAEKSKQKQMLITFLTTGRGIAFNRMFAMTEYPRDIMPLYSQGYSLARFLIAQGGKKQFVRYVGDGLEGSNWTAATSKHYGYRSLSELQIKWLEWVGRGSPPIDQTLLAARKNNLTPAVQVASNSSADLKMTPVPPLRSEPNNALASKLSTPGWRARPRGRTPGPATEALASFREDLPRRRASDRGEVNLVASPQSKPAPLQQPVQQSVTRPQSVGRPGQMILEWSRTGGQASPPRQTSKGAPTAAPPRSYYAVPMRDTGTVIR